MHAIPCCLLIPGLLMDGLFRCHVPAAHASSSITPVLLVGLVSGSEAIICFFKCPVKVLSVLAHQYNSLGSGCALKAWRQTNPCKPLISFAGRAFHYLFNFWSCVWNILNLRDHNGRAKPSGVDNRCIARAFNGEAIITASAKLSEKWREP